MSKEGRFDFTEAKDVEKRFKKLVKTLRTSWVDLSKISFLRSVNSKSKSFARVWGLPRIWQEVLKTPPHYIIEVISENFDRLRSNEKDKVLLHELAHLPKNFSGSLLPHNFNRKKGFKGRITHFLKIYKKRSL